MGKAIFGVVLNIAATAIALYLVYGPPKPDLAFGPIMLFLSGLLWGHDLARLLSWVDEEEDVD